MTKVKYKTRLNSTSILIYNDNCNTRCRFVLDKYKWDHLDEPEAFDVYVLRDVVGYYPNSMDYIFQKIPQLAQLLIKHIDRVRIVNKRYISIEYEYFIKSMLPEMEQIVDFEFII